jgi:hypothetical protein
MHPILSSGRRLTVYLALWIPILGLLALATRESLAVLWPACAIYAFLCLTPWYIGRSRPLQLSNATQLAVTHLAAAVVGGGLLAGSALAAAEVFQKRISSGAALF